MNPPTSIDTGRVDDHDALRRLQVVDAETGAVIPRVISANALTGAVRRFKVSYGPADSTLGELVVKDDSFVIIDEQRDIRIEWIATPDEVAE